MYGSFHAAAPTDLNRPFPLPTHQNQMSSGLLRYRSAPSSLLAEICEDFNPDSDSIFSRFLQSESSQLPPPPPPTVYQQPQNQDHNTVTSSSAMVTSSSDIKNSSLVRQSSSPAGFLSNLDNGYGVMRGVPGNSGSLLRRQSSLMSQISENESIDDWEESKVLVDNINNNFSPRKRARENQSQQQNGLGHQLSLPKEMEAIEKFLQFQDSVPCKIRAKRGCATHPRSIAERVRRTKISERMRKLQELVPNMDKQTNTADMLDLAVDYIKELQKQVKTISDSRANCTCSSSKQKPYTHPAV